MKTYLVSIFNTKKDKKYFITDIITAQNENELFTLLIGKKYFKDSDQKRILGTCRKFEVIREI